MSTDFLMGFSHALVTRLAGEGLVELEPDRVPAVIQHLASQLATLGTGRSLLSSVEKVLLDCPDVEEVYFDLERLKEIVEDLR